MRHVHGPAVTGPLTGQLTGQLTGLLAGLLGVVQAKAAGLFAAIEPRGIIAPGVREVEASNAIRDLAAEMFGMDRHWHKRIVRAGPNTLPLDPRGSPGGPGAADRRFPRGTARPGLARGLRPGLGPVDGG